MNETHLNTVRKAPILELSALTKRYADLDAVSNVDLSVFEGEFVTLLGASGSGKSTVLMMIAGFTEPSAGDIRVRGTSIVRTAPHKRRIGVVFQNYALFPHLTVYENIAFPLRNAQQSEAEIETRVRELVGTVRLDNLQARLPGQLSGGQQQRVAIARALANKPDILLFDEPLGALDKSLREHMVVELQELHRQLGTTMVYVTHDQEEALVMSDRIAVMDGGRIIAKDTPQKLYDDPGSVFVAEFLGHSNVLTAPDGSLSAVRPEKIVMGQIPEGWTAKSGTVTSAIFLGNRMRYEVSIDGTQSVVISVPRANGVRALDIGAPVTIGWHRDDARPVEAGRGARTLAA